MRINEYNSLEEFRDEYAIGWCLYGLDKKAHYMGIEFVYKGTYYRMCREPGEDSLFPLLSDGRRGRYDVLIFPYDEQGVPSCDLEKLVGWYADIDDVLENCIIDGRKFRDVIMDDNTQIMSKD